MLLSARQCGLRNPLTSRECVPLLDECRLTLAAPIVCYSGYSAIEGMYGIQN